MSGNEAAIFPQVVQICNIPLNVGRKVVDIAAEPTVRERLLEMGFAPGREVCVLRHLPFGGPLIVQAGTLVVALRHTEASCVWVEAT
jgi:ferrous iron transport protein A